MLNSDIEQSKISSYKILFDHFCEFQTAKLIVNSLLFAEQGNFDFQVAA